MKKNKGFSLVELIIVIAIMAILAAAIAPALIRYIDKSRKADDVTAAGTIATAANAALANEAAYESVDSAMDGTTVVAIGAPGSAFTAGNTAYQKFVDEMNKNLTGNVAPKLKFKKTLESDTGVTPGGWLVTISKDVPKVYIANASATAIGTGNAVEVQPSINEDYQ
jgi:type IV pilus assembly protein PilA